eukprot:3068580-Amphidinium_carterae.1
MSTVTLFEISANSFEGTLPGSGLQVMRAVNCFFRWHESLHRNASQRRLRGACRAQYLVRKEQ